MSGAPGQVGSPAIRTEHLSKRFGSFVAVNDVSFEVPAGSIFGLLGANGAGKSTTIRMLCGLLVPSSGTAIVGGEDVATNPEGIKRRIGYMSQRFSLYDDLTVTENIRFFGGVYGLSRGDLAARLRETVRVAGLEGNELRLARELPTGWKQRLALGCALLHGPGIVFLDEPTGGTDPLSRRAFWDIINDMSGRGTTVLVTTHYLDEAEYCNDLVLMHGGEIIARGSPGELKKEALAGASYELDCSDPAAAIPVLRRVNGVIDAAFFGARLHVGLEREEDLPRIMEALAAAGILVAGSARIVPSLEDVFIRLIDRRERERA